MVCVISQNIYVHFFLGFSSLLSILAVTKKVEKWLTESEFQVYLLVQLTV